MEERKSFEEIMEIYLKKYPQLTHLARKPRFFAKAAIILVAPEGITPKDLAVLARATQYIPPIQDKETLEELIEWGKKNGY